MGMMALCCGAPLILLLLVPLLGTGIPGLKGILTRLVPFICPVMMIIMIPMMFKGKKSNADKNDNQQDNQIKLDDKTRE
jgi:uncharacterized membrane protein YkvI